MDNYLISVATDKSKKMNGAEILFLERALQHRKQLEDIRLWNEAACNDGYTITETGLAYKVIEKANGTKAEPGDKVKVHYTGYLANGRKFDSSHDRNQPFEFTIAKGMVIKGWDEGLQLMNVGSRYLFRIPADLAYGNRAVGNIIPPNATLYFDVVLLGVE
jgi:FKBP-type peptidyl-prolyl cis-trans isomerase